VNFSGMVALNADYKENDLPQKWDLKKSRKKIISWARHYQEFFPSLGNIFCQRDLATLRDGRYWGLAVKEKNGRVIFFTAVPNQCSCVTRAAFDHPR
jgi:hypothetical protein